MSTLGTQLDASEVLAAALEQMDGIIAGTKLEFHDGVNDNHSCTFRTKLHENHSRTVNNLLKELRDAVEIYMGNDANDNRAMKEEIDPDTRYFLLRWLQHSLPPEYTKQQRGTGAICRRG
ncbi:liprin-beta-1-like isoform X2 [Centruroides sculpturatus]|uniref:liprin-beta-1-like isoform X2 n=1 Tax=Centruroides sculpturatus TaxID=218467 RepID=UPI000C6D5EC7|nr:liprin-beta-1-like isoform X2 [Centruroides sculpturatus]